MVLVGFGGILMAATAKTTMQLAVPDYLRGRVISAVVHHVLRGLDAQDRRACSWAVFASAFGVAVSLAIGGVLAVATGVGSLILGNSASRVGMGYRPTGRGRRGAVEAGPLPRRDGWRPQADSPSRAEQGPGRAGLSHQPRRALRAAAARPAEEQAAAANSNPSATNPTLSSTTSCFVMRFVGRSAKTLCSWSALSAG